MEKINAGGKEDSDKLKLALKNICLKMQLN